MEGAKIYAENAIRNKNEELNYLKLASRVDAVAARVNTAAKMGTLTKNMSGVTKALDSCMKQFSLEKVSSFSQNRIHNNYTCFWSPAPSLDHYS